MSEFVKDGRERWLSCSFAIPQLGVMSGAVEDPQNGYNSDYSCKDPQVVNKARAQRVVIDTYTQTTGETVLEAVEICEGGLISEPHIQQTLDVVCGRCVFYRPKDS